MKDRAGRGRGLQPTLSAHPQPCARPPATTTAAAGAGEPVRPAQPSQILPTRPLVKEPRPELLIGPRIVTPAGWTPIVSHDHHGTSLKQICRTYARLRAPSAHEGWSGAVMAACTIRLMRSTASSGRG